MKFEDYQAEAHKFAFPNMPTMEPVLGLGGEAGEVLEKFKKLLRGDYDITPDFHGPTLGGPMVPFRDYEKFSSDVKKELGDVLWYLAEIASVHGWNLGELAQANLDKLTDRRQRGVSRGNGDHR